MGRQKPGKPRRPRSGGHTYTLEELRPPGSVYEEWINVQRGMDVSKVQDPGLTAEALDLMHRLARLGPLYGYRVPQAAILLDFAIDARHLPVLNDGKTGTLLTLEEIAAAQGGTSEDEIRELIHNLHAAGALLVGHDDEHDAAYVRIVMKRPDQPGGTWHFMGETDVPVATVCLPQDVWQELSPDVAAAVAYIRSCEARLEEPDPAAYGTHKGVNGVKHATELFAAARDSGYVDYKGCDVCPAGHLCTREDTQED